MPNGADLPVKTSVRTLSVALKTAFFCSCALIVYCRLSSYAGNMIWPAVGFAALIGGRRDERAVAVVIALAVVATRLVVPEDLGAPRYGVLAVDLVETFVLAAIAVRSSLWWPSWCAGCHVASLGNHAIYMLWPDLVDPWAYASGLLVWSWLGFMPLAFGTLDACLRHRAQRMEAFA